MKLRFEYIKVKGDNKFIPKYFPRLIEFEGSMKEYKEVGRITFLVRQNDI